MGWWFGRILTFEVVADDGDPTIANLFEDVSAGAITVADVRTLGGYAASGKSARAALEPLVRTFDVALMDAGGTLGSPSSETIVIDEDELGSSADGAVVARLQRDQDPARSLPATVLLSYYDADRNYQSGLARADGGYRDGEELPIELPAVLPAGLARSLAEEVMARSWARRDRLRIALPSARMDLQAGTVFSVPGTPGSWRAERVTINGMAVAVELRPEWRPASSIPADAGRSNAAADVVFGDVSFSLIELPSLDGTTGSGPAIYLAASNRTSGWKVAPAEVAGANWIITTTTAARKSVLGSVTDTPGSGTSDLIDEINALSVQLLDAEQWLTNCDDDALMAGANLALIGSELLQFGRVEPLGGGAFRLSRLLRGRAGTEWAMAAHASGERFVLIDPAAFRQVPTPDWSVGTEIIARRPAQQESTAASLLITGDSLKPWSPVELQAVVTAYGDVDLTWVRRSRARCGWLDDVDVPLGERLEQYAVTVTVAGRSLDLSCTEPAVSLSAADLESLGAGLATIAVKQIGDWGASRPATIQINLS